MKKFLILCATILPLFSSYLFADNEETVCEIPLRRETETRHGRSIYPLEALYWKTISSIHISTTSDMGEITVIVTNLTTGEVYNDSFDSSVLTESVVLVNATPGVYEITLTSEYGDVYIGSFIID